MREDDLNRLRHMLDAAEEAYGFAKDKRKADLEENRMLVLAVLKDLEIVGEAANKVSSDTRRKCKTIPWCEIIGMRNRLIHGYFDIDYDIVYKTIVEDLPKLIEKLRKIVD
ncbi:MAG: HepT-like ribonuclease domain-containing protein [Candidatus Altiarchaeota archaeon]